MNVLSSVFSNLLKGKYYLLAGILIIAFIIGATEFIHQVRGIPYADLTRDPNTISLKPKYIGFVSQIGLFFWFGTVSLCLASAIILKHLAGDSLYVLYFRFFSFFTFVLGVDDVFMLHDESAHRGINEKVIYIIYIVSLLYFLVKSFKLVFKTNFVLLFIAGLFLGLSVLWDVLYSSDYFIEDSFKIIGIVFWFLYFLDTTIKSVINTTRGTIIEKA
ncbi:MAG: hypothetical protein CUR34_14450 [Sediminibacterium sp.]|nr:MAG: hypothetical protein CUR34_14450 [Sediminibacterium sp.] [Sediminibacterium sp. FEMGT703S]